MNVITRSLCALLLLGAGCGGDRSDSPTSGTLYVLVAESIAPAVVRQANEFNVLYGANGARIYCVVVPSKEAVSRFVSDTFKVAIAVDSLTDSESSAMRAGSQVFVERTVAYDGISVVVHPDNPVASLSTDDLASVLKGTTTRWEQLSEPAGASGRIRLIVQENADASAYLSGRLLPGDTVTTQRVPARNALDVLRLTRESVAAIGFVGSSWVDSVQTTVKQVKIRMTTPPESAWYDVPPEAEGKSYTAHPAYVYQRYYAFRRSVVLLGRSAKADIVSGFSAFIVDKAGQGIFLESGMVPATQPIRLNPSP